MPVTLLFLLPLWLMVVGSLRPLGEAPPRSVSWWPASPAWSNYAEVFDVVPLARYTANSLLVAAVAVPLVGARRVVGGVRDRAAADGARACS